MSTPRVPLLDPAAATVAPATLDAILRRRGGTLSPLDQVLIHSDAVARGWNDMFSGLYGGMDLTPRLREIAVLQVCRLTQARFEGFHHRRLALKLGLGEAEVAAIEQGATDAFAPQERAVLAYAQAMTQQVRVPDAVFAALKPHFDDRQLVELTTLIAVYNMVARLTEALELLPVAP